MKLINPENSYSNNIAGKVGPVIKESFLSDDLCNWLTEQISSIYEEDLAQALLLAKYIKIIGSNEDIPEDDTLFRLFCTIRGFIHAPNLPITRNEELEGSILKYILSNYSSDFHSFMLSLIQEREERLRSGGPAIYIKTGDIAVFMINKKLIDYKRFIKLSNVPVALYQLCKNDTEWTSEDYSIEENLFMFVKDLHILFQ